MLNFNQTNETLRTLQAILAQPWHRVCVEGYEACAQVDEP